MEAVGHLASMEDAYLRRMYASKVVSGMNHLSKAIAEKEDDSGYEHWKRDLGLMKKAVMAAKEHLKKEYEVSENNISYKWNNKTMKNNNKNKTAPKSLNTWLKTESTPEVEENLINVGNLNEYENTLKAANKGVELNEEENPKTLLGGKRRRMTKRSKRTRRY